MNGVVLPSPPPGMTDSRATATRRCLRPRVVLALCALVVVVCPLLYALGSGGGASSAGVSESGWSAVPLSARGLVASTVGASEPSFRVRRSGAGGGLVAVNRGQRWRAAFSPVGARVTSAGGGWLGLRLASVSGAGPSFGVGMARLSGNGNRVSYRYRGVSESFANGPLGLEQSFTLRGPGRGRVARGPVVVSMALSGDLRAKLAGGALTFSRDGRPVLAYRDLLVRDARGRPIPARLALADGRAQIRIDAAGAMFPLRVDPFVQSAELTASDGASGDQLGYSVAVSEDGSTVVAGAPGHTVGGSSDQGAVYVFTDTGGTWSQSGELTASDGASGDSLGSSVAVDADGSTIVAGAPYHTVGANSDQGAAYSFTGNATSGWSQSGELTAKDGGTDDYLGYSVAVSEDGSTVVAGAGGHNGDEGAAYVFTKLSGDQTQTAELTASDGASGDSLGSSVAVDADGSTIVAGAPFRAAKGQSGQGAVYVFTGNATSGWSQSGELTAKDGDSSDSFGYSVGISANGATIVAGAPGHTPSGGNSEQGAIYVFTGNATSGWSQSGELTATDGAVHDYLGFSVGVSADGSTVVGGTPDRTVDGNELQGAAYVFSNTAGTWSQSGELTATDGAASDALGGSVGVSSDGSTVVAGASSRNSSLGTAYVFTRIPTTTTTTSSTVSSTAPAPCSRASRFVTHIRTKHITGREIKLTGIAEAKCPDHITKIGIALAHFDKGRCSFLNPDHKFAPYGTCTPHDYLKANGTSHWTYTLHHTFTRGVYHLWEHATNNQHQSTHNTAARHVYFWAG